MTALKDHQQMCRTARRVIARRWDTPTSAWVTLTYAKVLQVVSSIGAKPSAASFTFENVRWSVAEPYGLQRGTRVSIITDDPIEGQEAQTILFEGVVVNFQRSFAGGDENGSGGFERLIVQCADYRWLLSQTSPIFSMVVRGVDDYDHETGMGLTNKCLYLARPVIFNKDGRPDCDAHPLIVLNDSRWPGFAGEIPIFCPHTKTDAEFWTIRKMLRHIVSPLHNRSRPVTSFLDPLANIAGGLKLCQLDPSVFPELDTVVHSVAIPTGASLPEAVERILVQIGYTYREDPSNDFGPMWTIYKPGSASQTVRNATTAPIILQSLYAPAVNESINTSVAAGKHMVLAGLFDEDLTPTISRPYGLGASDLFEATFELVPAWKDDDLVPDTDDLYQRESDLQQPDADPEQYSFYQKYHVSGSLFMRDVGRKWALNESGKYTDALTYNRGVRFDFNTVCDAGLVASGDPLRRNYAPFERVFKPCLTLDKDTLNSMGVKVEFSFDGGTTWQTLQAAITVCQDECAIRIEDPNLSEILPKNTSDLNIDIDGLGTMVTTELNYWTRLCADWFNWDADPENFSWPHRQMRCRVTASVEMDQAIHAWPAQSANAGTPFEQMRIFDFTARYGRKLRMAGSVLTGSAWEIPLHSEQLSAQIDFLQSVNEDVAIASRFTLDRLWMGDGSGFPQFCCGDGITQLEGRNFSLKSGSSASSLYPEISEIVYNVQQQVMDLILRDTKMSRVQLQSMTRRTDTGRRRR
ncbi:MAG: hypothetical protein LLF76_08175 [Planctomycetaceae bacterium]|nr:hypothetical protein [Planctomycetaceae bacterium]